MKYGFSTLGCPRQEFGSIVSWAIDLGYDGIEIRGIADEMYAPRVKAFDSARIDRSLATIAHKLEIPMLTTGAVIAVKGEETAAFNEVKDYLELAKRLDAKYLRVLCTNTVEPSGGDYDFAVKNYKEILKMAEGSGVTPLIETNGMFVDSALTKRFVEEVGGNAGILWDIHHPYRFGNESISTTVANIGKYIRYVHIKDSVIEDGKCRYKMLGHGDLPIKDAVAALEGIGYDGYITLEWTKRWNPDLEDAGIVFAQFISAIKEYV